MRIKLFVKQDCPRCPAAKALTAGFDDVEQFDVENVDGLSEAAFYGVLSTPSIVVLDDDGKEIVSWRGDVPSKEELISRISQ